MADQIIWDDELTDTSGIVWDDEKPKKQPDSFMSRALTGLADPIVGAGQIMDKVLVNPIRQAISPGASSMSDVVRERDRTYNAPEGFDAARLVGNIANPVSWAGGGQGVLRAAGNAAVQSALAPISPDADFLSEKAKQASTGAVIGSVLSKAVKGFTPTKEARQLMDEGVQPSFGQSMGGLANTLEQRLTSVPFVGDAVSFARNRPMKEFQAKVIERATNGSAKTLDEANAYAGRLYDEVVPYLTPTTQAVQNIQQVVRGAMQNPEMTDQNKTILTGLVQKYGQNFGQLSGEGIKKLDSELGYLGRKYSAGDPASQTLADEIYKLQDALRSGLEHGLPPNLQGKAQEANRTWRELIAVNKAASQRADERIAPRALQRAIAAQAKTDVTRMRPDALVDSAVAVLPQTVPDSGTAGRALLGAAGAMGSGTFGMLPQYLGAGAAAYTGATRPMQRALVGNTPMQRAAVPYDAYLASLLAAALRGKPRDDEQP